MTDPEDWELCCSIVRAAAAHPELRIPVTVKIRLQPRLEDTCNFACMLAEAGARLVAVHGRMRGSEDRRRDGSADLHAVSEVVRWEPCPSSAFLQAVPHILLVKSSQSVITRIQTRDDR